MVEEILKYLSDEIKHREKYHEDAFDLICISMSIYEIYYGTPVDFTTA